MRDAVKKLNIWRLALNELINKVNLFAFNNNILQLKPHDPIQDLCLSYQAVFKQTFSYSKSEIYDHRVHKLSKIPGLSAADFYYDRKFLRSINMKALDDGSYLLINTASKFKIFIIMYNPILKVIKREVAPPTLSHRRTRIIDVETNQNSIVINYDCRYEIYYY